MDVHTLESIPMFAGLSKKEREQVARWADVVDVPAGHALLEEGRFAHEFFVILDGVVEVTKDGVHLRDLGPGDFFGEIALVEHERRTATVATTTPLRAIVMHARDFEEMRAELPHVAHQIREAIGRRPGR